MKTKLLTTIMIGFGLLPFSNALGDCSDGEGSEAWGGTEWELIFQGYSAVYYQRECNSCFSVEARVECQPMGDIPSSKVEYINDEGMLISQVLAYCSEHATFSCPD